MDDEPRWPADRIGRVLTVAAYLGLVLTLYILVNTLTGWGWRP